MCFTESDLTNFRRLRLIVQGISVGAVGIEEDSFFAGRTDD